MRQFRLRVFELCHFATSCASVRAEEVVNIEYKELRARPGSKPQVDQPSPRDQTACRTRRESPGRRTMKEPRPTALYTPHTVLRQTIDPGIFLRLTCAPSSRLSTVYLSLSLSAVLSLSSPSDRQRSVAVLACSSVGMVRTRFLELTWTKSR